MEWLSTSKIGPGDSGSSVRSVLIIAARIVELFKLQRSGISWCSIEGRRGQIANGAAPTELDRTHTTVVSINRPLRTELNLSSAPRISVRRLHAFHRTPEALVGFLRARLDRHLGSGVSHRDGSGRADPQCFVSARQDRNRNGFLLTIRTDYLAGNVGLPGAGGQVPRMSCCRRWIHSRNGRESIETLKSLKCARFNAASTSFFNCVLMSDLASSAQPLNEPVLSSSALAAAMRVS